jgi:type IV secretory pathway TraG/TraD family ATPase VirD4
MKGFFYLPEAQSVYLFFLDNPDYYFYGIATSISIMILFSAKWKSQDQRTLLEGFLLSLKKLCLSVSLIFVAIVPIFLFYMASNVYGQIHVEYWNDIFKNGLTRSIFTIISFPLIALWAKFIIKRYIYTYYSSLKTSLRFRVSGASISDIRMEQGRVTQSNYNPQKYYKNNNILLGLDEEEKPLYISYEDWKSKNMRVVAPTQKGKGVLIGMIIDQVIRLGSLPIVVDGKPDRHLLSIIKKACGVMGVNLVIINFYEDSEYGYEPFLCGTDAEVKERLWEILGLQDVGNTADHYKKLERNYISELIKYGWDKKTASLLASLKNQKIFDPTSSVDILNEFLLNSAVSTNKNLIDIDEILRSNTVIYVRSKLDSVKIKLLTKCFIRNVIQSASRQDLNGVVHRPIVIDEVKFFVSKMLSDAIATMLDFGINFVLTYQCVSDLLSIDDKNQNAKAIVESINTNCSLTYAGMAADNTTAKYFEEETGTIVKKIYDRQKIETNETGGDKFVGEAFLTNQEVPLIPANKFLTFPKMTGVIINKPALAKIIKTSFVLIDTKKEYDYIKPTYPDKEIETAEVKKKIKNKSSTKKIEKQINEPVHTLQIEELDDSIKYNNIDSDDYSDLFDD